MIKSSLLWKAGKAFKSTFTGKTIIMEDQKGITLIGINRPHKRNCIDPDTAHELVEAFQTFEGNAVSPVAILHGKGGYFCSGLDLGSVSSFGQNGTPLDSYFFDPNSKNGVGPMGPSRRFFSKPVVAAINGYAVAGGLELSLMCDLRVMEETAVLGVFCRRFGVPLIDGGTVRLPHLIGLSRALDLILTGRPVQGKEAFDIGIANRLVPHGKALEEAIELASSIMKFPQECMNRDRTSACYAMYSAKTFEDAVRNEMEKGLEVIHKESVQGAMSFVRGTGRHGSFDNLKLPI